MQNSSTSTNKETKGQHNTQLQHNWLLWHLMMDKIISEHSTPSGTAVPGEFIYLEIASATEGFDKSFQFFTMTLPSIQITRSSNPSRKKRDHTLLERLWTTGSLLINRASYMPRMSAPYQITMWKMVLATTAPSPLLSSQLQKHSATSSSHQQCKSHLRHSCCCSCWQDRNHSA